MKSHEASTYLSSASTSNSVIPFHIISTNEIRKRVIADGMVVSGAERGADRCGFRRGHWSRPSVTFLPSFTKVQEIPRALQFALLAQSVTVAAETTRAYLDACSYAHALNVAQDSYRASNESLRLVTAQEKAGSVGRFDVERAAAAAATARAAIPSLEAQHQAALFELAALLGSTPADIPLAAQQCTKPPAAVALPVGDGASLLRRRPDLRQAERQLAADTARIGVATAALYPKISLGGSGNFFRNDSVRGNDSLSFSVGPLLSWSFPNVSVARARIRQAEAQGDASLAAFDGAVITALKQVEQALSNVAREQERLSILGEARTRSQRAFDFATARYRAGSVGLLDVLVAQTALLDARAAEAASLQRLSSLRVDLFKSLGGGWRDIEA